MAAPPAQGTLLELHSLAKTEFNGQVVAFESAQDGKWLVKSCTLADFNPITIFPKNTKPLLSPEGEEVPAPSLEDLLPTKGVILELHGINQDFNGKLVEFQRLDKDTGKYCVISHDEKKQSMKVKPKCCRRPTMKPREFRVKLNSVISHYVEKFKDITSDTAGENAVLQVLHMEDRTKLILQADPCCAPAYFFLGLASTLLRIGVQATEEEIAKSVYDQHYRGMANLYAYDDVISTRQLLRAKREIANFLRELGKHSASIDYQKSIISDAKWECCEEEVYDQFELVKHFLAAAESYHRRELYAKEVQSCLNCAEQICLMIKNKRYKEEIGDDYFKNLEEAVRQILMKFQPIHRVLVQEQMAQSEGRRKSKQKVPPSEETEALWQTAGNIVNQLTAAYTAAGGLSRLVSDNTAKWLANIEMMAKIVLGSEDIYLMPVLQWE